MEDVMIVGIVFGFAAFCFTGVYRLIRLKIERNSGFDEEMFERLARAFTQHRKEMEKRVQNLETIVAREYDESESFPQIEEPQEETVLKNDLEKKRRVK